MADVTATAERTLGAPAFRVRRLLADYKTVRPKILTEQYSDYVLHSGSVGEGVAAGWKLAATKKRTRDVLVDVSLPTADRIVETDRNSTMVTTWRIAPGKAGTCKVTVTTTWKGAGGIGGFFERTFAPKGLQAIYDGVLAKLDDLVEQDKVSPVDTGDDDAS